MLTIIEWVTIIAAIWLGAASLVVTTWHLSAQAHRRHSYQAAQAAQFLTDYYDGLAAGGKDKLDALIEATREPHAWEPGADQPVPYVPATPADGDWDFWEDDMQKGSGL